jgi:hypothetical protein
LSVTPLTALFVLTYVKRDVFHGTVFHSADFSSGYYRVGYGPERMMVELGDVLKAIGPNASIVFAAWIFMTFLQQRYDSATDRYRETVGDYRSNDHDDERAGNLRGQILVYRHRCKLMGWATLIGLVAAILLISALILGAIDVILPKVPLIVGAGTAAAIAGFLLVIVAAIVVIIEGRIVHRQLDDELRDIPDLVEATKHGADTPIRRGSAT